MALYPSTKESASVKSNAGSETFPFDITSALASANIPAYATVTKAILTVWGDIDTATSRGKMTATFGSTTICSDVWCGGSANEVSKSASILSHINSGNANAGKLKTSTDRLTIVLDGPIMVSKFTHTASWQLELEWSNHSHSWNSGSVTKAATCLSAGTKTYTCTVCGATKTETLSALGHSFGSTTAAKAATCTTAGNSAYKKCSRCGLYFSGDASTTATGGKSDTSSFVIPAKGHTQVTIPAVAPTCESTGLTEGKKCSVCGTIITAQQTVAKLGHNYVGVVTKEPTCTDKGIKTYTCQNDASHKYTEDISALGHTWGTPTYTWSADGKTCTAKRVCSRCNTTETATATITSKVKTNATCTAKGTTTYTATFGVSWAATQNKDVQDIPIKSHTEVTIPAISPTCTATGLTEGKKCSVCGTILVAQTTVPATGHSYNSVVTQPTPTTAGYTTHTCSRCGHSYVDSYVYFPEFTSVSMTYLNKQISASNKVPCREGFIISAKVT